MNAMSTRETILFTLLALVATSGVASAQDPTVNESDYDTAPPTSDESYLDESQASGDEPSVGESDFDTTAPTYDESYLDDGVATEGGDAKGAPGLGVALVAAAGVAAALVQRRR